MEMGENLLLDFRLSKASSYNQYLHIDFVPIVLAKNMCDNQVNINILMQTVSLPPLQIPGISMKLRVIHIHNF